MLNQSVDVEIGNFEFNGDVIIHGDVLDGFKVTATGNIEVYGGVLNAQLDAGEFWSPKALWGYRND